MFEVGDRVFCEMFGVGTIKARDTSPSNVFPMIVTFSMGDKYYTPGGYYTFLGRDSPEWQQYFITKQEQQMKPQCTTQAEVLEQFARVSKMIEGTNLTIKDVFKYDGLLHSWDKFDIMNMPGFYADYSFALAIIEGKPVFVGDKLWFYPNLGDTEQFTILPNWKLENVFNGKVSWQEPKRTFMFNGEELPLPDADEGYYLHVSTLKEYRWKNAEDRDRVQEVFVKLLRGESK